jgi:hypothetical protein
VVTNPAARRPCSLQRGGAEAAKTDERSAGLNRAQKALIELRQTRARLRGNSSFEPKRSRSAALSTLLSAVVGRPAAGAPGAASGMVGRRQVTVVRGKGHDGRSGLRLSADLRGGFLE